MFSPQNLYFISKNLTIFHIILLYHFFKIFQHSCLTFLLQNGISEGKRGRSALPLLQLRKPAQIFQQPDAVFYPLLIDNLSSWLLILRILSKYCVRDHLKEGAKQCKIFALLLLSLEVAAGEVVDWFATRAPLPSFFVLG